MGSLYIGVDFQSPELAANCIQRNPQNSAGRYHAKPIRKADHMIVRSKFVVDITLEVDFRRRIILSAHFVVKDGTFFSQWSFFVVLDVETLELKRVLAESKSSRTAQELTTMMGR